MSSPAPAIIVPSVPAFSHRAKVCNTCGRLHASIPSNARFSEDVLLGGWYWECACGSTMFIPLRTLAEIAVLLDMEEAS